MVPLTVSTLRGGRWGDLRIGPPPKSKAPLAPLISVRNQGAQAHPRAHQKKPSSGLGFESGEDLCQVLDGGAGIDDADSHGGAAINGGRGEQGGAVVQ